MSIKKNTLYIITILIILISSFLDVKAQSDTAYISAADTIQLTPAPEINPHSPHKASFYSAILPGLGQAYNKKYWKIPIVYAALGGLVYAIDFNSTYYTRYKNAYRDYLIQDPANKSYESLLPNGFDLTTIEPGGSNATWFEGVLESKKQYYKKYRDISYVGFALVYVLNIIDASVDAHFKTFDVSNDLSLHWEPIVTPVGSQFNQVGLQVRLVF